MRIFVKSLALLAVILLAGCGPSIATDVSQLTPTPFLPAAVTSTPYLPLHPTITPAPLPLTDQNFQFHGIDFSPGAEEIILRFWPAGEKLNNGRPIKVRFLPGAECNFGDHQACVNHFRSPDNTEVIWVSVHSGVLGEGQALRHAMEGTGINTAGLSLDQVFQNLAEWKKSSVSLRQGELTVELIQVNAVSRVPADQLRDYLTAPFDRALEIAFDGQLALIPSAPPGSTLLILETCGWRMPGEPGSELVTDTTASIYIGIMQ